MFMCKRKKRANFRWSWRCMGQEGGWKQSLLIAQAFVKAGAEVVAVSRSGYGRTDPKGRFSSPSAQARLMLAFARTLPALRKRKFLVLGWSAGADIALTMGQVCPRHIH